MAVFSEHWHRVAALRPRLVPQLAVVRQQVRGEVWYLLADRVSGRSCRLNASAYALAGRLDGRHTLQQLWDRLQAMAPVTSPRVTPVLPAAPVTAGGTGLAPCATEPPTQDEAIDLLARLREQGLVEVDRAADFARLLPHLHDGRTRARRFNPLAWRRPLGDPSRLVDRLAPLARALFSPLGALVWGLAIVALVAQAVAQADALAAYSAAALGRPSIALWAMLAWLPLKAWHELAHALALRRFGGTVHEAGITLMLGLPVPYVDASGANALGARRARVLVGAAGMAAELALAAPALALWAASADGPLREAAFAVLGVVTVSALLFNANPLQRLDGYHIACDLLQLPNLASRSRAWWHALLQRRLLRLPGARPMPLARREAPWLAAYAPLAWAWQAVVLGASVAWVASWSAPAGAALALLALVQVGLRPPWQLYRQLQRSAAVSGTAGRRLRAAAAAVLLAVPALLAVPLPRHSVALGVVWPPEQAQLRPETSGFVHELLRADGQAVAAGEPVLRLRDPQLEAQIARQQARLAALDGEWHAALPDGGARSADLQASLALARAELDRLRQRAEGLVVRAGVAGTIALPQAQDLIGRHAPQGRLLGQVLTDAPPTVRVALPEDEAQALRSRRQAVAVWRADGPATPQPARVLQETPAAVQRLPSAALARRHGGAIETDPQDSEALRSLQPVVLLDVQLDLPLDAPMDKPLAGPQADTRADPRTDPQANLQANRAASAHTDFPHPDARRLGTRAWVRFDEGAAPLAVQAWAALRRAWLRHAHPQQ